MNYLLDACAFLWLALRPERLGPQSADAIRSTRNNLFLSSVTVWEIGLKYEIGKLQLPEPPARFIPAARIGHDIQALELTERHTFPLAELPSIHKDPFDRMLVCQALEESLTIITPDPRIIQYSVPTIW